MVNGTVVNLLPTDKDPNCYHHSYRNCSVPGLLGKGGKDRHHFQVPHGAHFFDAHHCRSCQCHDGDPYAFCSNSSSKCSMLVPKGHPQNCTLPDGSTLEHGMKIRAEIGVCGCYNGWLKCLHAHHHHNNMTHTEVPHDKCHQCMLQHPPAPVCGSDGRNHISLCSAMHCAGVPPVTISHSPCQSRVSSYDT